MRILAVEQPRYLPDLEFFFKMKQTDVFVLADTFQYSTHSSINRTRIKTANGAKWLTVPIQTKDKHRQLISEVHIDNSHEWKRNHWRTLEVNYCMTPYFERYSSFLQDSFCMDWERLIDLNLHFIQYLSRELLFTGHTGLGSYLPNSSDRTQRVINWLRATNCDMYLLSQKQKTLIDIGLIQKEGFTIKTYEFESTRYFQQFSDFVTGLSIIDLLCNEGPGSIELLIRSA